MRSEAAASSGLNKKIPHQSQVRGQGKTKPCPALHTQPLPELNLIPKNKYKTLPIPLGNSTIYIGSQIL